ncbi:hypothetical protein MNAN1_001164 [Malassezia nana]|uniref:SGF29 C-terminal domain-containing protein n=1 Tax=Malassezia nana TaxID=180528 RepID=A0AAF0EGT8_9BASI|nr:hypothetical protein MNAN1_001164 [Malassezia nana]
MALRRASALPAETRRKKRKTDEANLAEASLDTHAKLLEPRKSRSASAARVGEEKGRRAELQNQLPLQRGRKVAFCQPPKDAQSGSEEEWILATVIGTIQGDKYRYVVQDAEDESSGGPVDTLPSEDYAVGARVLALYPDTSCFYWATVQGGGPRIQAHTSRSKDTKRDNDVLQTPYKLMFYDDGSDVKQVPAYLVVAHP